MKNTKMLIVELIENNPGLTSEEISQKLNLTQAGIRYHTLQLLKTGEIKTTGVKIDGRGRPARIYHIQNNANDPGLQNLAEIIFNMLKTLSIDDPIKMIANAFPFPNLEHLSVSPRLRESMQVLENYQYRPTWEATREGPKVCFHGCPYSTIIQKHPELCHMDLLILNRLTGLEFYQTVKIDLKTSNPACCVFQRKLN